MIGKFLKNITKTYGWIYVFNYPAERLVKIGVSDTVKRRLKEVDRALPKEASLLYSAMVFQPYDLETAIHRKFYDKKKVPLKAKQGSGKHEFYRLSFIEKIKLKIIITKQAFVFTLAVDIIPILLIFVVISFVAPDLFLEVIRVFW